MGYRYRLGKVKKSEKEKFDGLNYQKAEKLINDRYAVYRPEFHNQIYELDSFDHSCLKYEHFYSFDIFEETECEFYILCKEGLRTIIDSYHQIIYEEYEDLLTCDQEFKKLVFIKSKLRTWDNKNGILPYYIDEKEDTDGDIVKSWDYEYAIFNLVYIYRTFDWKNDYLIISAW